MRAISQHQFPVAIPIIVLKKDKPFVPKGTTLVFTMASEPNDMVEHCYYDRLIALHFEMNVICSNPVIFSLMTSYLGYKAFDLPNTHHNVLLIYSTQITLHTLLPVSIRQGV